MAADISKGKRQLGDRRVERMAVGEVRKRENATTNISKRKRQVRYR